MVVVIQEMGPSEIDRFLRSQVVGRIGCHVGGTTYVVPIIYAWDGDCAYVYSVEGQKIEMMRDNPKVCFEVDEYQSGGGWRSVIVQGAYEELTGDAAARTLGLLADRFARRRPDDGETQRPRGEGRTPVAFRIRAQETTGRKVNRSLPAGAKRQAGKLLAQRRARKG